MTIVETAEMYHFELDNGFSFTIGFPSETDANEFADSIADMIVEFTYIESIDLNTPPF